MARGVSEGSMASWLAWCGAAGASVAVGAGLFLAPILFGASSTIVVSVSSSCPHQSFAVGGEPTVPPTRTETLALRDGERFDVDEPAGEWRLKLRAENASFAHVGSDGQLRAVGPSMWTTGFDSGWCRAEEERATYLARGDGSLHLAYHTGAGSGAGPAGGR